MPQKKVTGTALSQQETRRPYLPIIAKGNHDVNIIPCAVFPFKAVGITNKT
jgi:hypothetical protein